MKIVTKDPDKREEIRKKRTGLGTPNFPGVKIVGEWSTIQNDRVFVVLDVTDPRDLALMVAPFASLVHDEIFPIMETEEMLKLLSTGK